LKLAGSSPLAALVVNLTGFALIIGVAWIAAYFKSQPWKTAPVRTVAPAAEADWQTKVRT
jgi:hypothetical protein